MLQSFSAGLKSIRNLAGDVAGMHQIIRTMRENILPQSIYSSSWQRILELEASSGWHARESLPDSSVEHTTNTDMEDWLSETWEEDIGDDRSD